MERLYEDIKKSGNENCDNIDNLMITQQAKSTYMNNKKNKI